MVSVTLRAFTEDLTKAMESNPKDSSLFYERGLAKYEIENYVGAINDYSYAINIDSSRWFFYEKRGNANLELKDAYGAIADYSKAIELNPSKGILHFKRGFSKRLIEDYKGAMADYTGDPFVLGCLG